MTNTDVVGAIMTLVGDFTVFMLPVIGVLAGLTFVFSFLMSVTMGLGRKTFGG